MPNDDVLAPINEAFTTSDSAERLTRWMRIPEAWVALRMLEPDVAAQVQTPFELADRLRQSLASSGSVPATWDALRSAATGAPTGISQVLERADAIRQADKRSLHADIAGVVMGHPDAWRSAIALAWPDLAGQALVAASLVASPRPASAALLANTLLASGSTRGAAAALHSLLGDAASSALPGLLQAGEKDLARALAETAPASKGSPAGVEAYLASAAHAQSAGDLALARQTLIAGWGIASDLGATFGDRLANVAQAEGDLVSACEASMRALLAQPTRERKARIAVLLAETGRSAEARNWLSQTPETASEHIAAAAVSLAAGESEQAETHLIRAVAAAGADEEITPDWLERLAAGLELAGQPADAVPVLNRLARVRPEDPSVRARLAQNLLAAGDAPTAAAHALVVCGMQPASGPARRLLARALRAAGQPGEALAHWDAIPEPETEDRLESARCAMDAGKPEIAIHAAESILEAKSTSAVGLALLGRALMAAGRHTEARDRLEAACAADPRDPEAWTALAECHLALGDLQASGATLAAAVQAAPRSSAVLHAYATCLRREGRTSEALEAAAQAIASGDAPAEWNLEYGELLVELGHFERATDVLRTALAQRPGAWPVRRVLAEALIGCGQTAEAAALVTALPENADVKACAFAGQVLVNYAGTSHDETAAHKGLTLLERAFEHQPAPEIEVGLARALELTGRAADALEHFRSALERPEALTAELHQQASVGLSKCALTLNRAPLAIHALEAASARHGLSAEVQIALSAAYAAGGQHRRALEAAQRAAELSPDEASLRQLTHAAALAGEGGLAQHAIQRLAALQPTSPHVWLTLAELAGQSQDDAQARQALARALRLARADASAWSRASDLLLRLGRPASAQRALRKALTAAPQDAELVRQMADVSLKAGDEATAQRAWMRYADLRTDDAEGMKLAARSLWLLNQRAVAIGLWQRAVSLAPHDADAHRDLARAYLTEGDSARAVDHYRIVAQPTATDLGLLLEAAAAELHYGSPDRAVDLYRSVTGMASQDISAWVGLGESLLMLRRPHEARPALETAYRLDPTRVQTLGALAIAALDTGDAPMAAAIYTSAQRQPCKTAPAAAALARAALALAQWDDALAALDNLNHTSPSLASLRAAVETRLRLTDAAWLFQSAGAHSHAPTVTAEASSTIQGLLTQLASTAPAWEADRLRQRAAMASDESDPDALLDAARADPSGEALEGLAVAYLRQGRPEAALALVAPDASGPLGRWQRLLAGLAYSQLGQLEDAQHALQEAGADAALRPLAEYLLARTYLPQGDGDAFAAHASNALVEWSDEPVWHFELGSAYLHSGQADAALPHLAQAAGLAPEIGDYALALARTAQDAGDLATAQSGYARALELMPSDGQVWKDAGLCALANGDEAKASQWLERARVLLPGDVDSLIGAARASLAASSLREAHEHIQTAYHLAPENGDVLLVMGEVFARQGKLDKALQSFDRALKRSEFPLPIHVARSRLLLQIGRGEQAVATLKAAVADDPESDAGWAALSQIEDAAGNLSEAVDAAGRAVQIAPRQTSHRLQLGRLCRKAGQLDRALDELLRAQSTGYSDGQVFFELGRIYEERREFKRSLDAYQRTIDLDSSNGEAHFRAGLVLKQIKAYQQAGKMLKRAVELNPKDPDALHQLAAVRALELVHGGLSRQVVAP